MKEQTNIAVLEYYSKLTALCATGRTIVAPLERVSNILQVQDAIVHNSKNNTSISKGYFMAFSDIYRTEGIKSFWRGNFSNCLLILPTFISNFYLKRYFKTLIPKCDFSDEYNHIKQAFYKTRAAILPATITAAVLFPLEQIKTRLTVDLGKNKKYKGIIDVIRQTLKSKNGILGLFKGSGAFLIHKTLFTASYLSYINGFENIRYFRNIGIPSGVDSFFWYQISFICASYLTYPLLTISNRLKLQADVPKQDWKYKRNVIQQICKEEGFMGLYKGFGIVPLKSILLSLILLQTEKLLNKNDIFISKV
eukprot:gene11387-4554_t